MTILNRLICLFNGNFAKPALVLIACWVFMGKGGAQNFLHLPFDAKWKVEAPDPRFSSPGQSTNIWYFTDSTYQDTSGLVWHEFAHLGYGDCNGYAYPSPYPGSSSLQRKFIAEDTVNNLVRIEGVGNGILYDYNLIPGDTFQDVWLSWMNFLVDSIRTKDFFGTQRRVWYFHVLPPVLSHKIYFLVEGLGLSSGLLEPWIGNDQFYFDPILVCVQDSSGLLYADSNSCSFSEGCDTLIIIPISVEKEVLHHVSIYPNPGNDKINIVTETKEISRVTFYSLTGKRIIVIEDCGRDCEIDAHLFSPGIYFYKIELGERQFLSGKWLKVPLD